jgi:hypothetical protein
METPNVCDPEGQIEVFISHKQETYYWEETTIVLCDTVEPYGNCPPASSTHPGYQIVTRTVATHVPADSKLTERCECVGTTPFPLYRIIHSGGSTEKVLDRVLQKKVLRWVIIGIDVTTGTITEEKGPAHFSECFPAGEMIA